MPRRHSLLRLKSKLLLRLFPAATRQDVLSAVYDLTGKYIHACYSYASLKILIFFACLFVFAKGEAILFSETAIRLHEV